VCELSWELNYKENIKVKSFFVYRVPYLGLVRILVWVLCWLTDCLNEQLLVGIQPQAVLLVCLISEAVLDNGEAK
jgi:hypothetical protein